MYYFCFLDASSSTSVDNAVVDPKLTEYNQVNLDECISTAVEIVELNDKDQCVV